MPPRSGRKRRRRSHDIARGARCSTGLQLPDERRLGSRQLRRGRRLLRALYTFFVDDASWRALLDELDLDVAAYTDPENPRAIGLNTYQDRMPDGTYVSTKPFAGTGAVDLYVTEEREGFSNMGLQEGPDGRPGGYSTGRPGSAGRPTSSPPRSTRRPRLSASR
ncbi:MAG: hypothetical protein ACLSVD_14340 [Eggerthellaceae bacterium]